MAVKGSAKAKSVKRKTVKSKAPVKAGKPKTLRELFTSARRWCQHKGSDDNGAFCLLGGIGRVYPIDRHYEVEERLMKAIEELYGPDPGHGPATRVMTFNDAPKRKFSEIKRVIHLARV